MSDLEWCKRVEKFCKDNNLPFETAINSLKGKDYYKIAYTQFRSGASERRVEDYLRRAAMDADLID